MFDRFCQVSVSSNQSINDTFCSLNQTIPRLGPKVSTFTYVVELYFIGIVCLIGLPANIISIVVMRRDRERREALFLLQVLAVADGFYLLIALLRYPLKYMIQDSLAFQTMQLYVFPLLKTAQTIAIFMMVFVTVDRYVYVCIPLRAHQLLNRRKRWIFTVLIFLFGFIFNMPRFVDVCILRYMRCGRLAMAAVVYAHHFNHSLYYDIYQCALYIIVLYAIPLAMLVILNTRLISAIRRSRRKHRLRMQNPKERYGDHTDNNATLVLVIIVLVFILCETPELVFRVTTSVFRAVKRMESAMDMTVHYDLATVLELLMVVNSSTNFFIYCIFGRRFRQVMRDTFQYKPSHQTTLVVMAATHESVPLQQQLYRG